MKKIILLSTLFFCGLQFNYAQHAGDLDSSFGINGRLAEDFIKYNEYDENILQVFSQSNSVYIALIGGVNGGANALASFHSDGSINKSFARDGYLFIDFTVSKSAQQSDGKFLIAGSGYIYDPFTQVFYLARFNPDGTQDKTFGIDGKIKNDFAITSLVIQHNGKILVAGGGYDDFAIARYNSDGSPDLSLDQDGKLTNDFFDGNISIHSVAVQNDGKIIVAGTIFTPDDCDRCGGGEGSYEYILIRYNSNGTLDHTFGKDGKINPDFNYENEFGEGGGNILVMLTDEKIVLAGTKWNGSNFDVVVARYNKDGSLDNSFNKNGLHPADFGDNDFPSSVAFQNDGKILITAYTGGTYPEDSKNFALVRYNKDGTPDKTFSGDGKLSTNFGINAFANSLAVQSDGKIIVAGGTTGAISYDFAFARYNANGSPDHAFSGDGKEIGFVPHGRGFLTSLAVQSDGKIVVAGEADSVNSKGFLLTGFFIARYNSDGSPDKTFDSDGKQTIHFFGYRFARLESLAIQNDGKIVVGGSVIIPSLTQQNDTSYFAIARYNTDGSPDITFGEDGKQVTKLDKKYTYNTIYSLAIQNDGKIVAGGTVYTNVLTSTSIFIIVRYNSDGSLDNTFGSNGKQITNFSQSDAANSLAISGDQKILVSGEFKTSNNSYFDIALNRYNKDGSLDKTFSGDGKQITHFSNESGYAESIALQKDGKILVAGYLRHEISDDEENEKFAVIRYNNDGSLDATFDKDGKVITSFGSDEFASTVAVQDDGKIILAGTAYHAPFASNIAIARYNENGSLDNTFGSDGKLITDFGGDERADDAAIYKDKLYTIGSSFVNLIAAYKLKGKDDIAPVVNLTLPDHNTIYSSPASIRLTATASDVDGTISKVEFYNGTHLLHTEHAAPYGFSWNNVAVGEYTLTAKATDNSGNVTTSNSIKVSVIDNKAPSVSIILPADNVSYSSPASVFIRAAAHDEDGTIKNVAFYNGTALLHTEYVAPYGFLWKDVPVGKYKLTAKATDNSGLTSTSAVIHVSVVASATPMVSIEYSINNNINGILSLKLSPNPAHNILNISINGRPDKPAELYVLSASGVVLKNIHPVTSNQLPLDVSSLANGVYFIKIICGDKVMYKQFVKM